MAQFVLTALNVEHETAEAVAIRLQRFEDRVGDHRELVSTKARRYQDDPRVLRVRRDSFVSELDEINDIRGNDRPSSARRVGELSTVVQLGVADLLGPARVYAVLTKEFGNGGRQSLIEVDLHRVKRTSPGYCLSIVSGVIAAFASILA